MNVNNKKYLVTGCAGFIGSNLVEYLVENGAIVTGLDNFLTGKKENMNTFINSDNFTFIEGDIRSLETCIGATKDVDYVLHQAALGSVPRSVEDPKTSHEVNVDGTLNMFIAARDNKVKGLVYASSSSVYGDSDVLPKKEGEEGNLLSPYAFTKKSAEEYATLFNRLYDMNVIGLRYFNIFGKRQDPDSIYAAVIPKFVASLKKGEAPTINGDGLQSRDFTYIDNVIMANILASQADNKYSGEAYNVGCGGQVILNDLYDTICKNMNVDIKCNYGPERVGDVKHSNADISKIKNDLGYNVKIKYEEGIGKCINWYVENL